MYADGMGFVPDEIIENAEVFILAQNPGAEEEAQGKPKVGPVGQVEARDFFPKGGLSRGHVSLGNVLRCRWRHGNQLPTGDTLIRAVRHCTRYLQIPASTRLVVAEGALAWKYVGGPGSIKAWRGYLSPTDFRGIATLGVLHAGDLIQHEKRLKFPSLLDWRKIRRFLAGTWPQPAPSCWLWDGDVARLRG